MKKLFLLSLLISLTSPMKTIAGFPEGEKGYDLKKIEESFKLPCDEIGNDECIARALAIHSSLPISSQGNLNDSSIFLRSYPFSPSGKPAIVFIGEVKLINSDRRNNFFILVEGFKKFLFFDLTFYCL